MEKIIHKFICKTCNIEFIPKKFDRRERRHSYCSTKCRYSFNKKPALEKVCKLCKLKLLDKRKHYHNDCLLLKNRQYASAYDAKKKIQKEIKCKQCGVVFLPKYKDKRRSFCSVLCCKRYMRKVAGRGNARKLARKYNVAYESINPLKVFERDGWECRICRTKTPKSKRGTTSPKAPELDHRIPISKGGGHLYTNVQCLCRRCNGLKSNKNNNGQKPLFEIKSNYRGVGIS